jgi:5-methylcytosine-specific restriction endonuclease McrA
MQVSVHNHIMRRTYDHRWQRVRAAVLERDEHECQIRAAGCTGVATHVDHIVPIAEGGRRLDTTNLRAACATCNLGRVSGRSRMLADALNSSGEQKPSRTW